MKKLPDNRRRGTTRRIVAAVTALALVGLVAAGAATAWSRLHATWVEQCVVTDVSSQVSVTSGKMVKGDVIAENFGLRKGANLALIDFDAKRREVLAKIPNLKSISVVKRLPDKVTIVAEERSPIVRMGIKGSRSDTGRVADAEGMVFLCSRGTRMLPVIREAAAPGSPVGKRLDEAKKYKDIFEELINAQPPLWAGATPPPRSRGREWTTQAPPRARSSPADSGCSSRPSAPGSATTP